MAWVIIDVNGEALTDIDGDLILVNTEAEAREWMMRDDQRVERFDAWAKSRDEIGRRPDALA